jgi:hypothetical protein
LGLVALARRRQGQIARRQLLRARRRCPRSWALHRAAPAPRHRAQPPAEPRAPHDRPLSPLRRAPRSVVRSSMRGGLQRLPARNPRRLMPRRKPQPPLRRAQPSAARSRRSGGPCRPPALCPRRRLFLDWLSLPPRRAQRSVARCRKRREPNRPLTCDPRRRPSCAALLLHLALRRRRALRWALRQRKPPRGHCSPSALPAPARQTPPARALSAARRRPCRSHGTSWIRWLGCSSEQMLRTSRPCVGG